MRQLGPGSYSKTGVEYDRFIDVGKFANLISKTLSPMWSVVQQSKALSDRSGYISPSVSDFVPQPERLGKNQEYLQLYNDTFYQEVKTQYVVGIEGLTTLNEESLSVMHSLRAQIIKLLPVDADVESNTYFRKWKQLLFVVQKAIIKAHFDIVKSFGPSDTAEMNFPFSVKDTYSLAIDNFELMLQLQTQESIALDLVMIQLLLFWALKVGDYRLFQQVLSQYSSQFNHFYDHYLAEQWKIIPTLPLCTTEEVSKIFFPDKFSIVNEPNEYESFIPLLVWDDFSVLITFYENLWRLLENHIYNSDDIISHIESSFIFLLRSLSGLNPSESDHFDSNETMKNSTSTSGTNANPRRMSTRYSSVSMDEEEAAAIPLSLDASSQIVIDHNNGSSTSMVNSRVLENKLKVPCGDSDILKIEVFFAFSPFFNLSDTNSLK